MKQPPMNHYAGPDSPADSPEQRHVKVFADDDKKLIERSGFFFLATTDADGWPECSYQGGLPGFVRLADENNLAFPCYDGDGMSRSLDNIRVNPKVGLLFIDLEEPRRLRLIGTASIHEDDPLLKRFDGAQLLVRVQVAHVFPSRTRSIHRWWLVENPESVQELDQ